MSGGHVAKPLAAACEETWREAMACALCVWWQPTWCGSMQVYTTCGSEKERAFLLERFAGLARDHIGSSTSPAFEAVVKRGAVRGVDLVLNCLAGEMLQVSPPHLRQMVMIFDLPLHWKHNQFRSSSKLAHLCHHKACLHS